jgi:hypothetical protein
MLLFSVVVSSFLYSSIIILPSPKFLLISLLTADIRNLAKTYNLNIKVTMPCVHCYRKKVYDVNEFTLRECEMALESGLSVVYCHGLVPVRLDKVAPDIALAAVSDLKGKK